MSLPVTSVRPGKTVTLNASTPVTAVERDTIKRTYRLYCASAIYFAVTKVDDATITNTGDGTGAPLAAGVIEFIEVPAGEQLSVLGTGAHTLYVNEAKKSI